MMRITPGQLRLNPDRVKTVAFVCVKRQDGKMVPKGTAFFVAYQNTQTMKFQIYVVTARHVLDGIRERLGLDTCFVSYNGPNGKEETEIPLSSWHFHPDDLSEYVDVAVARFNYRDPEASGQRFPNPIHVRCWMYNNLIPLSVANQAEIGLGSPVGLAGLFVHHQGSNRNIPIVRTGNIAAMPDEPVPTTKGPMTAYLIEIRSIGGLSGSPVFAAILIEEGVIGLVHGHFDQRDTNPDISIEDADSSFGENKINAGIAVVVPADRIRETLKQLIDVDFYGGRGAER